MKPTRITQYPENSNHNLGAAYIPKAPACFSLEVSTPDSMNYEIHASMQRLENEVGDLVDYVLDKLEYPSKAALCKALSAEQIDAVALAIYNIEVKNKGLVIGDQTGIGKGRTAAAILRYAIKKGYFPVFITVGANLFSDFYRDLADIDFLEARPLILNSDVSIKVPDKNAKKGEVKWVELYKSFPASQIKEITQIAEDNIINPGFDKNSPEMAKHLENVDYLMATYSQFQNKGSKPYLLKILSRNSIVILDESHKASGSGSGGKLTNTGKVFTNMLEETKGAVFLSATFAKTANNMPLYALKTSMKDSGLSRAGLIDVISQGGFALQEVLSSQLVASGEMIRRERTFENVKTEYIPLKEYREEHRALSDKVTEFLRDLIVLDKAVSGIIKNIDKLIKKELDEEVPSSMLKKMGASRSPFFSKLFLMVKQLLFSLKAEAVGHHAVKLVKQGYKPVVAFGSTMETYIKEYTVGEEVNADFSVVIDHALEKVLEYTVKGPVENPKTGKIDIEKTTRKITPEQLPIDLQNSFFELKERIKQMSVGITLSPIDVVSKIITDAGYTFHEVTGRSKKINFEVSYEKGIIEPNSKVKREEAFFQFNNNETDILLINQSGSTGASAHAHIPKNGTITDDEIKPRVMIIQEPELDISTEVQKRGRVKRTGQKFEPEYHYIQTEIPAEKRLFMMLKSKLKSLDANTTSSQKSSDEILESDDFLNKYGDEIAANYLFNNPEINKVLGDFDLKTSAGSGGKNVMYPEGIAHTASGRAAMLTVQQQEDFYDTIITEYKSYVEKLVQSGDYDLDVRIMNLEAETKSRDVVIAGNGKSRFGGNTYLELCEVNNLRKPFTQKELTIILENELKGKTPREKQIELLNELDETTQSMIDSENERIESKYAKIIEKISSEKKYKEQETELEKRRYFEIRKEEIESDKNKELSSSIDRINTKAKTVREIFEFFTIGRSLNVSVRGAGDTMTEVKSVFMGYKIADKPGNKFTPSNVVLRVAVANGLKFIDYVVSRELNDIVSIQAFSQNLYVDTQLESIHYNDSGKVNYLNEWDDLRREESNDRKRAYIVTGNMLNAIQKYGDQGQLISYSTIDGKEKKGLLMKSGFDPTKGGGQKILIPIKSGEKIIRELPPNARIGGSHGLTFHNVGPYIRIMSKRTMNEGMNTDEELLNLTRENDMHLVQGEYIATIPIESLTDLIDLLSNKYGASLSVSPGQVENLDDIDLTEDYEDDLPLIDLPDPDKVEAFRKRRRETIDNIRELDNRNDKKAANTLYEAAQEYKGPEDYAINTLSKSSAVQKLVEKDEVDKLINLLNTMYEQKKKAMIRKVKLRVEMMKREKVSA